MIRRLLTFLVLATGLAAPPLQAEEASWLFVFGPSAGLNLVSPDGTALDYDAYLKADMLLSVRNSLSIGGYYTFSTRVEFDFFDYSSIQDQEYLRLVLGFDRFAIEAGLLSSVLGGIGNTTYLNPDWKIMADVSAGQGPGQLEICYSGYLLYLPEVADDVFFQGLRLSGRFDPSITFGFSMGGSAGWEYHYEQPVYGLTGSETGLYRHDLVVEIGAEADGMIGFFSEWSLGGDVEWRMSNATFFTAPDFFLDRSEDRMIASIDTSIFTSPHRSITMEGTLFSDQTWYLARTARTYSGSYSTDNLFILDVGATARIDWTPNQTFFIVLEGNGAYSYSNDPFVRSWYVESRLAVEFSL